MGFPTPTPTPASIGALAIANNLSDVANAATSRANLAVLGIAANLSDVNNAVTALANLSGYPLHYTVNAQTGTTYTLVLTDDGKLVTLSNAFAITLTVPTNASVAFAVGAQILLAQIGAGQVTVAAAVGVTINSSPGLKISAQWKYATLIKRATDTWDLVGSLSA